MYRYRFEHSDKCEWLLFNSRNGKRRSVSQPNINRNWKCPQCGWCNRTVAWHCLNCDYPSILAPIYKATIKKVRNDDRLSFGIGGGDNVRNNCDDNIKNNGGQQKQEHDRNYKEYPIQMLTKCKRKSCMSMDTDLNTTKISNDILGTNKKRCQLCLFNRYDLFSDDSNNICRHNIKFPDYIKLPYVIDDLSKGHNNSNSGDTSELFSHKNFNKYTTKRVNKSLSSISDPVGSDCLNDKETIVEELKVDTSSSKYIRQLSEPCSAQSELKNRIYQNVTCDICGICSNSSDNNKFGHHLLDSSDRKNESRFTITTLKRQKSLSDQLKIGDTSTLNRYRAGVLIEVKDWISATPVSSKSSPYKIKKMDNKRFYENTQVLHQNNNSNPPYENLSEFIGVREKNGDKNDNSVVMNHSRKKNQSPPLYAVVNKQSKSTNNKSNNVILNKQDTEQTRYSYIGINNPMEQCDNSEDDGIYATITNTANNNVNSSNANNGDDYATLINSSISKLSNFGLTNEVKSTHITSTSCLNSNEPNGVSETGDIYAKVWKGPKKSMDTQKRYLYIKILF